MRALAFLLLWPVVVSAADPTRILHEDDFRQGLARWHVEQVPGGTVTTRDGALVVEGPGGCSVWFREKLTAPIEITYSVTVLSRGGPHDRVSDVNCFWMATDPQRPHAMPSGRTGVFEEYDALRTYYVGMGGNSNRTTRFRRYAGDGTKPLLPQHDLSDRRFLLDPNKTYRIRIVSLADRIEFWSDDVRVFAFTDPEPLTSGWFAFRTTKSHLEFRNFRVSKPHQP